MQESKAKPGRGYYWLAGLVFAAGLTAFVWLLFSELSTLGDGLTQVVVPGEQELSLSETGGHTIFHEYQSIVGNKIYSMSQGGLSGLQLTLRSKLTGEEVPLSRSAVNSTYSMGSRAGVSVFDFQLDAAGIYLLSAHYEPGVEGPEAVLSVGHGFEKQLMVTIVSALGIMFGTIGGAAAIVVVTYIKREKALKNLQQDAGTR